MSGDAVAPAAAGIDRAALYRRGALARAMMMAGAMERALDTAVTYAGERKQFGRPIGKFQAVQQNLAVLAGQVAAAGAAADAGVEALSIDDPAKQEFLIAIAKTRVGDAATLASEIAHQVHGAIGFTKEYSLQLSHAPAVVVARRIRRRHRMGGAGGRLCLRARRRCAVAHADNDG